MEPRSGNRAKQEKGFDSPFLAMEETEHSRVTGTGREPARSHQLLLVAIQATALLALVGRHLLTLTLLTAGHSYL